MRGRASRPTRRPIWTGKPQPDLWAGELGYFGGDTGDPGTLTGEGVPPDCAVGLGVIHSRAQAKPKPRVLKSSSGFGAAEAPQGNLGWAPQGNLTVQCMGASGLRKMHPQIQVILLCDSASFHSLSGPQSPHLDHLETVGPISSGLPSS